MKKLLTIASASILFISCNSNNKESSLNKTQNVLVPDTVGMYKSNVMTDKSNTTNTSAATNNNQVATYSPRASRPVRKVKRYKNVAQHSSNQSNDTYIPANDNNSNGNNTVYNEPMPKDKKISAAAQGTAIGGAGGAVIGAIVSKNKGQGAVIGAILGGGAGYAIGRNKDKKSGRVERQRARRAAAKGY